jgi:hypothetical protein
MLPRLYLNIPSLLSEELELNKKYLLILDMDYKVIRLNSKDADITSSNKKDYTFFLNIPIILNDEYVLQVKEFIIDTADTGGAGGGRVITSVFAEDMFVSNNNSNWGSTSLGIYTYFAQYDARTYTFEVYDNAGTKQARILSLTQNYNVNNFNGTWSRIYFQATPPFWVIEGGSLTHATLGNNFVWNKATDMTTSATQTRTLIEPTTPNQKRYTIKLDNIQHLPSEYINSDKVYVPQIIYLQLSKTVIRRPKDDNYLLTLPPQLISNIKISLEDEAGNGLTIAEDNFSICLLLKKKKYIAVI